MKREDAATRITEGTRALHDALCQGRSEELEHYLSVMSRFHRYSFGNVMLVLMQRENATHVAGYTRWKELGRQVKRGEKGIGILAPLTYKKTPEDAGDEDAGQVAFFGFKVVYVFDVSQTEGTELPEFAATKGNPGENLARIEQVIRDQGITLVDEEHLGGANGMASGGVITLRAGLTPAECFRVCCHELAHERLHFGERRHETTKTVRETEAEAVAFVVSNALGLDCTRRSADYIQLYRGDVDTLAESLEHIQKTAVLILDGIENVDLSCNHTLHIEEPGSTWSGVTTDDGTRFECGVCGRFYGLTPQAPAPAPEMVADTMLSDEATVAEADKAEQKPELRVGRSDYEERRESRIERLETRAEKVRSDSTATHEQARTMAEVIPFGQPMMPGHHSYKRDRNYRERIQGKFRKSFELQDKAKRLEDRATAAASNDAISSDDPEALLKLREKLQALEERQAQMKKLNGAWRKAGKPGPDEIEAWHKVAAIMNVEPAKMQRLGRALSGVQHFSNDRDRAPHPPYELSNNNANIRRVRERIKELEREGTLTQSTAVDHGICRVIENVEINRVQLVFQGNPEEAVRKLLKQHGFRRARSEQAWQRQLNNAGRYAAKAVVETLKGETHERAANA